MHSSRLAWFMGGVVLLAACGDDDKKRSDTAAEVSTDATSSETTDATIGDTVTDTSVTDTSVTDTATDTGTPTDTEIDTATDTGTPTDTEIDTGTPTDTGVPTDIEIDTATDATTTDTGTPTDTTVTEVADTSDVVTPPSGEACDDAFVVTLPATFSAPVVVSGNTSGAIDDHDVAEGACPGVDWELGLGSPDEVWAFTAPTAGSYRITLSAATADLALYILSGCTAASQGQCLRAGDAIGGGAADVARVTLAANETVFVVVDAFPSIPIEAGAYTLTFDPPSAAPLGDVCSQAIAIQPGPGGYVGTGDNGVATSLSDDYDASSCGAFFDGAGVNDQVWRFTPPTTGRWVVTVTPNGSADPMIYVFDDATCSGACEGHVDDNEGGTAETLALDLVENDDVLIVVDSWIPEAGGGYLIKIAAGCAPSCTAGSCADDGCGTRCPCSGSDTCNPGTNLCEACEPSCADGACGVADGCGGQCGCDIGDVCDPVASACVTPTAGDTCADAIALTEELDGSLSGIGDLSSGRADDVVTGTCPAASGFPFDGVGTPDETWTFQVPSTGRYTVAVLSDTDVDVFFMLFTGPGCASAACLGAADDGLDGEIDSADFDLVAGTDYTLVVDTWSVTQAGSYLIDVTTYVPPIEGDGCAAPYALDAGTGGVQTGAGDLSAVDVTDADEFEVGGCADLGDAPFPPDGIDTPDEVFELVVPTSGSYRIRVASEALVDVFLQVLVGDDCESAACVGYLDDVFEAATEEVTLTLDKTKTYWLVVDTYATFAAGAYTIEVAPVCSAVCAPGYCGLDACGDPCTCGSGDICVSQACVPIEGDSCDDPYALTTVDTAQVGDGDLSMTGLVDDFELTGCPDLGDSFAAEDAGTPDEVFGFTVPVAGRYTIEVSPDEAGLDVMWGLFAGPSCASATCVGYLDELESGDAESVDVELQASTSYWLVVDYYALSDAGPYTVTVTYHPVAVSPCASAPSLTLGVASTGTTTGATDSFDGLDCPGSAVNGVGQGDVVYRLGLPLAGDYDVTLTPSGGADLALYAFGAAAGTCTDVCLDGSNASGVNGAETITVTAATANTDAYIVVDGATAAGAYSLDTSTDIEACATDLFFSEYIEGSGFSKALEIFNGTANHVDLSAYSIRVRQNTGSTSGTTGSYVNLALSGTLQAGQTYTLCHSSYTGKTCDFESSSSVVNFNGNDAVFLLKSGVVIDQIGLDDQPTTGPWAVGSGSTIDHTLVRNPAVRVGTSDWSIGATQWQVFAQDTSGNFDAHAYFWDCPYDTSTPPLATCSINFDTTPTCPTAATPVCGVNFSGGTCDGAINGNCYTSGTRSYRVTTGTPVEITFNGAVTRADAFIIGHQGGDAGKIEFFDASGASLGTITTPGVCSTSKPNQCISLPGTATRAVASVTSGTTMWIDDFRVNAPSCP